MNTRAGLFVAASLAGLAFVVATGGFGKGFSAQGGLDFAFIFIAGKTWLAGLNAYDSVLRHAVVAPMGLTPAMAGPLTQNLPSFAYPPNIFPLAALLGLFDFEAGKAAMKLISLASAAAMVLMLALSPGQGAAPAGHPGAAGGAQQRPWWVALAVLGSPFCAHVLWQGQTSLVASAAVLAAWFFQARRAPGLAGVMLGLAFIKPQLSAYVALWFVLQREWKLLACAAATALVCALPALCMPGPVVVLQSWLAELAIHRSADVVQPGFRHLMGIQSALAAAGLVLPNLFAAGAALTVAVWRFKQFLQPAEVLSLLISFVFLFSFVQDYDLVLMAPVIVYLFIAARTCVWFAFAAPVIVGLLFFPMRIVQSADIQLLLHYRTLGVFLIPCVVVASAAHKMSRHRRRVF